jgi:CRP/FNR family transcriptional regulator
MTLDELKGISIFRDIPDDILKVFVARFVEEDFGAGDMIFEEDSVSDRLFIIKKGEVEIRKMTDREDKGYKLIAVLQGGEFFGEMAVFQGHPRSADAVAKTPVSLVSISREELSEVLSRSPEAAFKVMGFFTSVLTERLGNTTKELVSVYKTGRLVTTAHDMNELSDYVLDSVFGAVELAEAGFFVIWNEFNEDFEIVGQRGFGEIEPNTAVPDDNSLLRLLLKSKEPLVCFNLQEDKRFFVPEDSAWKESSLLASPFILHDRMLGFVALFNRSRQSAFSYHHMILVSAISAYVSVAIENLQFVQAELDKSRLSQTNATIQPSL